MEKGGEIIDSENGLAFPWVKLVENGKWEKLQNVPHKKVVEYAK